jgi:2-polyprenyl-6-methoxyphenol hydroxylase-like FAD-dependent oxidoreductase
MVTTEKKKTQVLIVGAGPTGLMMASQLARSGIPFRLIEKNAGPTTQSRALVIQPRSLEILEQMGIADRAVKQGRIFQTINYVVNGKLAQRVPLGDFGKGLTQFPYLLILEQSKTEPLLANFLQQQGHNIEWRAELVSFTQTDSGVSATLKHHDKEETIEADWLIGADGASSLVRKTLSIPFGGEAYKESLFVLDCKINWPFKDDEAAIALSQDAFGLFFPMTDGRCRVSGIVSEEYADKDAISFDEVNRDFAKNLKMDLTLSDPQWISLYHAHHRYVAHFRKGRCFLAGDAAHVHSPAGAQGMNTGLQDAYNLAWKLALVLRGQAQEKILDTYHEERLPIARKLVRTTDRLFGITVSQNPFVVFWRVHVMPRLVALIPKEKHLLRFAFRVISQIGIHYRNSSLSRNASLGSFPRKAPRPGDRLPFVTFHERNKLISIQEKVKAPTFHLLLFSRNNNGERIKTIHDLVNPYGELIQIEVILFSLGSSDLYEAFGVQNGGYYLVRPDNYIAYRSTKFNEQHLKAFLESINLKSTVFKTSGRDRSESSTRGEEQSSINRKR